MNLGFPKTGTTALQQNIFKKLHSNSFFFAGTPNQSDEFKYSDEQLYVSQAFFDYVVLNKLFDEAKIKKILEGYNEVLISREGVLSAGVMPRSEADPIPLKVLFQRAKEFALKIDRNAEVKPIVIARRQDDLLHSLFCQSTRFSNTSDFNTYVSQFLSQPKWLEALNYHFVFSQLSNVFGEDSFYFDFYERFDKAPKEFLNDLLAFIGKVHEVPDNIAKVNVRRISQNKRVAKDYSLVNVLASYKRKLGIKRSFNLIALKTLLGRVTFKGKKIELEPAIRNKIKKVYFESNCHLFSELKLDCSYLGYIDEN